MRVKRLMISSELFCQLFTAGAHHGYRVVEQAIPEDARILNVRLGWPALMEILLESEMFDSVRQGEEIPDLTPLIMNGVHAESPDA